jgi:hypothetical protein
MHKLNLKKLDNVEGVTMLNRLIVSESVDDNVDISKA